jgi:thioesterase domain-containing protein
MYDVARQLTEAGDTVELVALADSVHPSIPQESHERRLRPGYRARKLFSRRAPELVAFRIRRALGRPRPKPVQFVPGSDVPADWPAALARERAYEAGPARWPVAILATEAYLTLAGAADLGWAPVLDAWEARTVPGDHYSMIGEPYVHVLAATLGECLGRTP